jgi:hypothetical protein
LMFYTLILKYTVYVKLVNLAATLISIIDICLTV